MSLYQFRRKLSFLISLPYSLFFNFYYLPFRQAIKMPIILYSPHFWSLKGRVVIDAPQVRFGMIRLGLFNASINNEKGFVWMNEAGTVIFHGSFAAGSGSVIKIGHPRAVLEIGDNVSNASSLKIDCHYRIIIGKRGKFGWGVIIMDSNLHRLKNSDGTWVGKGYDAVEIGENSWISSQCVILPGTKFPPYSVCALGSVLNRDYLNGEKGLYAGRPAKLIKTGIWRDMADNTIDYNEI